jgi:hypothetical protein
MKTRPLPQTFRSRGFDLAQVERRGQLAIFEQRHPSTARSWFEVVRIRATTPHPLADNPEGWERVESYPSAEAWGADGWTLPTLEAALEKLNALEAA